MRFYKVKSKRYHGLQKPFFFKMLPIYFFIFNSIYSLSAPFSDIVPEGSLNTLFSFITPLLALFRALPFIQNALLPRYLVKICSLYKLKLIP